MFIGRTNEIELLNRLVSSKKAELVVVYGRRRVGKSAILAKFGVEHDAFFFDGLEREPLQKQIQHFQKRLVEQTADPFLNSIVLESWESAFTYLTSKMKQKNQGGQRPILIFDEFQWMAGQKSSLISLLKSFWDEQWKQENPILILCGSIASFMINQVLKSRALYGRVSLEMHVKELSPHESYLLLQKRRSLLETFQYLSVFGGIPKYLEEIDIKKSFYQNMNRLCFSENGLMVEEFSRIFYGQFKEPQTYLKIVQALSKENLGLGEISKKVKIKSGGGLKRYISNLKLSEFIKDYVPIRKGARSKLKKYQILDSYLCFYFDFIQPHLKLIQIGQASFEKCVAQKWPSWQGYAFERFCLKNISKIIDILKISPLVTDYGPYYESGDQKFQIDLLIERKDQVLNLLEIKFKNEPIGTEVIPEVRQKISKIKLTRNQTIDPILISANGATKSLKESQFFSDILTLEDFF